MPFVLGSDGIFDCQISDFSQSDEISFRANVAKNIKGDFLKKI